MTNKPYFPSNVDYTEPFSPELLELWQYGMKDLRARRNRNLLWQIPVCVLFCVVIFLVSLNDTYAALLVGAATSTCLGATYLFLRPDFQYTVSEDRRSANFTLRYRFSTKELQSEILEFIATGKQGMGEALAVLGVILVSPILFIGLFLFGGPMIFNKIFWLTDFQALTESIFRSANHDGKEHVRGTNIQRSIALSGANPSTTKDISTDVFDGRIKLVATGGLVIDGGPSFDADSTFERLSVGDLILTRTDPGLLRVSVGDDEHAFFYNGSTWTKL